MSFGLYRQRNRFLTRLNGLVATHGCLRESHGVLGTKVGRVTARLMSWLFNMPCFSSKDVEFHPTIRARPWVPP